MEIIKQIMISIIIITLGHYLYTYLKDSLTDPAIVTIDRKKTIIKPIEVATQEMNTNATSSANTVSSANATSSVNNIPDDIETSLKDYIRELNTSNNSQNISTTSIDSLPSNIH